MGHIADCTPMLMLARSISYLSQFQKTLSDKQVISYFLYIQVQFYGLDLLASDFFVMQCVFLNMLFRNDKYISTRCNP